MALQRHLRLLKLTQQKTAIYDKMKEVALLPSAGAEQDRLRLNETFFDVVDAISTLSTVRNDCILYGIHVGMAPEYR